MIFSFGYKHGPMHKVDKTFDVRDLTHDIKAPEFVAKFNEIQDYAKAHPGERIAIGCEKGQHRSRFLANAVATSCRTSVFHRDK